MKVECIKNKRWLYLTLGKIYKVINISINDDYLIIDDNGYKFWFSKKWFKPLYEIRNKKINKLLKDESKMYK
jgi:hypothetical protein